MSSSEQAVGRMPPPPPRRELQLQGPRPTPLKVNKDSYKIRKPPAATAPPHHGGAAAGALVPAQPPRPPVIIYTVSPKVIHTNPGDFMSLVQRLTGHSSSADGGGADTVDLLSTADSSVMSPAARLASFEKVGPRRPTAVADHTMEELELPGGRQATGILSPVPSSLPPISPVFFSPAADPNAFSFLHEFSPAFHANRSFVEHTFLASPNNFLTTPTVPSPGPLWDLFNL